MKILSLEGTHEFQITLVGEEIDSLGSKATYKDLIGNLLFIELIYVTLSSTLTIYCHSLQPWKWVLYIVQLSII